MSFAYSMRGFRQTLMAAAAVVGDYLSLDFKNGTYRQTRNRQNLLTYSNDLSNVIWTDQFPTGPTLTTVDGFDCWAVASDGSASQQAYNSCTALALNRTYTFSFWVKSQSSAVQQFQIRHQQVGTSLSGGSVSSLSSAVLYAGDQWQRVQATITGPSSGTPSNIRVGVVVASGTISALYVRDFQLEEGTQATAYQATTTAASTPIPEVLQVSTAPRVNHASSPFAGSNNNSWSNDFANGVTMPAAYGGYVLPKGTTSTTFGRMAWSASMAGSGNKFAFQCAVKRGNHPFVKFQVNASGLLYHYFNFDTVSWGEGGATGIPVNANPPTSFKPATFEHIGNGIYLFKFYVELAALSNRDISCWISPSQTGDTVYAANDFIYAGYAMIEAGETLGTFINSGANPTADDGYADLHGYSYTRTGFKQELGTGTADGSNKVTNGTFDTDIAGWTESHSGATSWQAGRLRVTSLGTITRGYHQVSTLEIGKTYYFKIAVHAVTGSAQVRIGTTEDGTDIYNPTGISMTAGNSYYLEHVFTATTTTVHIAVRSATSASGSYVEADDVYLGEFGVRPIKGVPVGIPGVVPGKGFYARPSYANLVLQSQSPDQAVWTKQNVVPSYNAVVAPDGTQTADTFAITAGTAWAGIHQNFTTTANPATSSIYAKAGTCSFLQICDDHSSAGNYCNFDLVNGTVGTSSGLTGYIVPVAGYPGWYRCIVTYTATAVTNQLYFIHAGSASSGRAPILAAGLTLHLWQGQCINTTGATFPDGGPVIPSTTSAPTVAADTLAFTGQPAVAAENQVFLCTGTFGSESPTINAYWWALSDNGNNERIAAYSGGGNPTSITILNTAGGTSTFCTMTGGAVIAPGDKVASAVYRTPTTLQFFYKKQGGAMLTSSVFTVGFPSNLHRLDVGGDRGSSQLRGIVQDFRVRKGTFNAAQIETLLDGMLAA